MKAYVVLLLCTCLVPSSVLAQLGRHGGGQRINVQNRSANVNSNYNAKVNRNVNVNQNVNVNRNVNVNVHGGCYNCGYYNDNNWNWGSFAAGTAVGAVTTAVVASAALSFQYDCSGPSSGGRGGGACAAGRVLDSLCGRNSDLQLQQRLLPSLLSGHAACLSGRHLPVAKIDGSASQLQFKPTSIP
jgi:hypothetical protein